MAKEESEDTPGLSDEILDVEKITILPGASEDLSAATYCILEEDHTLGNLLRWMIMKNPAVEFCGYSAPHPSEAKIHIRIQTYDNVSSLKVMHEALANCENMTEAILRAYNDSLESDIYDQPEDVAYDFESINNRLWEEKEKNGLGSRAEFEQARKEKKEEEEKEEKEKKEKKVLAAKGKKAVKAEK